MSYDQSMETLKDKVVLITGGTSGIGKAILFALVKSGAKVYFLGRHQDKIDQTFRELNEEKVVSAVGLRADVASFDDLRSVFQEIGDLEGRLDILINNAALGARSIIDTELEMISYILQVNVGGYLYCSKLAIELMGKIGGQIVNIGSMSAHAKDRETDLYTSTKSAIEGFSVSLQKLVVQNGIKVTIIEPGSVATDMVDETEGQKAEAVSKKRMLMPKDIAEAVLFALTRNPRVDILRIQIKAEMQE